MNKFLMENLYAPIKGNSLELTDFNNKTPPFAICDFCFEKDLEQAKVNSNENRTEPQPTMSQIKALFTQLLTQIQTTHDTNSPLYQKTLKEQKEALIILESASESKQEKYLSLMKNISNLLTKPNLSLEEQTKLKQTGEQMDEMVEKLRSKQVKVEQKERNYKLYLGIGCGVLGMNNEYPKNRRNEIRKLIISKKNLQGSLNLSDFKNLEYLNFNLEMNNCPALAKLHCFDNRLANLNFLDGIEKENLESLNVRIGTFALSTNKHNYNYFAGSLEPLKNLNKLECLDIDDTDIEIGIEYLTDRLRTTSQEVHPELAQKARQEREEQNISFQQQIQAKVEENNYLQAQLSKTEKLLTLFQQIRIKKTEREQLFIKISQQLDNQDTNFWLTELNNLKGQAEQKPNDSEVRTNFLQTIKEKLQAQGVNLETIENLYQIQAEINELKQKLREKTEQTPQIIHKPT
ncbi:6831_t:CDS:2 [Funneliformis geosporum]|nr:6831_t:CDS:2 [Funneliformis geosporum]